MRLDYAQSGEYACYATRRFALSLSTRVPKLAHLGVESGGRGRGHLDTNLLRPGLGGVPTRWARLPAAAFTVRADARGVDYRCTAPRAAGRLRVRCGAGGRITVRFESERPFTGDFFVLSFATDAAPAALWGTPVAWPRVPAPAPRGGTVRTAYHLPLSLHFPDHGLLHVAGRDAPVRAVETFTQLPEMRGLCLGYRNAGHHNAMVAYHHGCVTVRFRALAPVTRATLELTVADEVYPRVPGCDFRAARWNGLKRCWLNAFAPQKETLTLGDNIALSGVAHLSMHMKADLLRYTPSLPDGIRIQNYLKRAIALSLEHAADVTGEVNWEYLDPARRGQGRCASFLDSTPSALISYASVFLHERDEAFGRRHLAAARRGARFLLALDRDGDGVLESPFHGNRFVDSPHRTRNWWDNFAFGHKDAYFNLLCRRAVRLLRQASVALGEGDPGELAAWQARFDAAFERTFFNPRTGVYAGWISRDGRVHDYLFTFISAMAVNEGLVPRARARRVLRILLDKLQQAGFGDCRYGIPGPLVPVAPRDTIKWDFMGAWPRYENGGLCGQTAYPFLQALYTVGLRREADRILFRMLETFENEPTHSGLMPGYMKSVDWRTKDGNPSGYNYLADNYLFLLAAVTRSVNTEH